MYLVLKPKRCSYWVTVLLSYWVIELLVSGQK
jgi:hypothetical protein